MAIPGQLAVFRAARHATLGETSDLAQAQLDWRPAEDKWSAGEVLDHLPKVDATYRSEIAELIRRAEAGEPAVLSRSFKDIDVSIFHLPKSLLPLFEIPFTITSRLLPRAVGAWMASSRAIPIQNPENAAPRRGQPKTELRAALEASLQGFEALFAAHPGIDYTRLIHKHPLFGINDVTQMLEILIAHEGRHQAQIREVIASPGFPAAT